MSERESVDTLARTAIAAPADGHDDARCRPTSMWSRHPAVTSLAAAVLLVICAYPGVVFGGGSLSSVGLNGVVSPRFHPKEAGIVPNPEGLSAESGMFDIGARVWQFEPATRLMSRSLRAGQDPSWNPYSATGSLGPETLADMKESPFVLTVAALGASVTAFTLVLLAFLVGSLYCLQQFFVRTLSMSRVAAVGAGIVFVLNGWAVAGVSSQMAAPYLIFPLVLYTLAEYQRTDRPWRLLVAVLAYAAMLVTTFLPTMVLMLLVVHAVAISLDLPRLRERRPEASWYELGGRSALRQLLLPALGVLVAAFVWLPNLDALRHAGDEFAAYGNVDLPTKPGYELLSVLTPRQLYRWYLPQTLPPDVAANAWTMYLGIVPVIVIASALARAKGRVRHLMIVTAAIGLVALALHVGLPGVKLLGNLPGLRPISARYWAGLSAACLCLAFGLAVESARRWGLSLRVAVVASGLIAAVFGLGLALRPTTKASYVAVAIVIGLSVLTMLLAWSMARWTTRRMWFLVGVVALVALELFSYQNHQRQQRVDIAGRLPSYITFLRDHLGSDRMMNVGRGGLYPEWGSALGIRQVESINLMQLPWYRKYFQTYVNPGENGRFLEIGRRPTSRFTSSPAALDELSVRYLVVDERFDKMRDEIARTYPVAFEDHDARITVFENLDVLPRARVSTSLVAGGEAPPESAGTTARTDDATFIQRAREAGVGGVPPADGGTTPSTSIVRDDATKVVVQTKSDAPGVLVLADSFHANWHATVDGHAAEIGLVNGTMRGVVIPAGSSTVEFSYESSARTVGAAISLLTLVTLALVVALLSISRRRAAAASPTRSSDVGAAGSG
jgi:hypothetical protein